MSNEELKQHAAKKRNLDRAPYVPPAIIYEGLITTRAATIESSPGGGSSSDSGASPEDIFSSDG